MERTMIDPCKAGKCISYPVCLGNAKIFNYECILIIMHLNDYIRKEIKHDPDDPCTDLSIDEVSILWSYVKTIYPKLDENEYKILLWRFGHYEG